MEAQEGFLRAGSKNEKRGCPVEGRKTGQRRVSRKKKFAATGCAAPGKMVKKRPWSD